MTEEKTICPECGTEMNFHAEKLVYSEYSQKAGAAMGEQMEEMHACPGCGHTESRLQG
jgi:NMD protein affecting ribosome stability and mRNA decay